MKGLKSGVANVMSLVINLDYASPEKENGSWTLGVMQEAEHEIVSDFFTITNNN